MAGKAINTILNLRDNMSGGLLKAARNTKGVTSEMKDATRAVIRFKDKAVSAVKDVVKSTAKLGAATAAGATAAFLAADGATEEYRIAMGKLNTAYDAVGMSTDDARYAYEEFYAVLGDTDTATEASQLLSKVARNGENIAYWTHIAAGVAGAFGDALPVEGLIEAANETARTGTVTGVLADALNWSAKEGETFGVTMRANTKANEDWNKAVAEAESAEDYFNLALQNCATEAQRNDLIMNTLMDTYDETADAFYKNNETVVQSRRNQAAMADVTAKLGAASATAKNGLMKLFGVQENGSLRAGSALEWLNDKADWLMGTFETWSQDGTMDALAQKLDQGLAKGAELASQGFQWLKDHGDELLAVIKPLGIAIGGFKLVKLGLDAADAANNFVLYAKTVGMVSISNLKAAGSWIKSTASMLINKGGLIATNVAAKACALGTGALTAAQTLLNAAFIASPVGWVVLGILALVAAGVALWKNWDTVKEYAGQLWEKIKSVFGGIGDSIIGAFNSAGDAVGGFFDWIGEKLGWLDDKIEGIPVIGDLYKGVKGAAGWIAGAISGHATGTSYFPGGLTRVNERGGEILNLPGGTKIIPHDVSERMVGGPSIRVSVVVQGNVIGNEGYADELGGIVARKVMAALGNT